MDLTQIALLAVVGAGYGVPVDGFPSDEERSLVLWTNAARVAPKEFKTEYSAGGCSLADFSDDEKTAKAPLYIDVALTEVARVHSKDMKDNGCFQHESCDGTDTWVRVAKYYTDANSGLGENIAMGTEDAKYAVMSMWMCSHSGHRANIMSGGFNEMGGGMAGQYLTQDFAMGELKEGDPPVRVAAEYGDEIYADWGDDDGPARLQLNVDGDRTNLELFVGSAEQGVYRQDIDAEPCTPWIVEWETESGEAGQFPEAGALLAGGCDDEYDAGASLGGGSGDDTEDIDGGDGIQLPELMCSTTGQAAGFGGVLMALAALGRRRR